MNFEKPPGRGEARVWIQNSPEFACLHLHFRPIYRGKGGEHSAVVSIMQEIHVLFIKLYVFQTEENAHITAYCNFWSVTRALFILFMCWWG